MKLLITGGCGFIGSNFIRHILRKYPDYKIINLDKLTYAGNPENLRDIEKDNNYTFVQGDICDNLLANKLIRACDYLVNFAACTHVDRSIKDSKEFIKTNVLGVHTLLEAVRRNNHLKLFLHISTDEVYGSVLKGKSKETDNLKPNSPYAASKAAGDLLIRSYYATYNLPVIITRSANNFGPFQYPEKVIPLFITNLLEGKKAPLYGDGLNERDWLFVDDNCQAIDTVLHKGKTGGIYNIGAGNSKKNIKLTEKILEFLNKDKSFIKYVADRPGHDRRYALDCSQARNLGWKPAYSLSRGLKLTIDWYRNNPQWWKKIKKEN